MDKIDFKMNTANIKGIKQRLLDVFFYVCVGNQG